MLSVVIHVIITYYDIPPIICVTTYVPMSMPGGVLTLTFEAIYKIMQASMESDQKKKTVFVKRSDIQQYINASELEPHMQKEK